MEYLQNYMNSITKTGKKSIESPLKPQNEFRIAENKNRLSWGTIDPNQQPKKLGAFENKRKTDENRVRYSQLQPVEIAQRPETAFQSRGTTLKSGTYNTESDSSYKPKSSETATETN